MATIDVFETVSIVESLRPVPNEEHLWVRAVAHERPSTDTFVKTDSYLGEFSKAGTTGGVADTNITAAGEFDFSREITNSSDPAWTSAADEASVLIVFRQTVVRGVNVFETITVAEDITVTYVGIFPEAADGVTTEDFANTYLPFIAMDAADAVTIIEGLLQTVRLDLDKSESVTVVDFVMFFPVLPASGSDDILAADDSTMLLPVLTIVDSEAVTIADFVTLSTGNIPFSNLIEEITVTELVELVLIHLNVDTSESVTVADDAPVNLSTYVVVNENVSTFETPDLLLPFLVPAASDPTTLVDDTALVTQSVTRFVNVSDTVATADAIVSINQSLRPDISDTIAAAESITISLFTKVIFIERGDNVTTTELIDFPGGVNFAIGGITEITVIVDDEGTE